MPTYEISDVMLVDVQWWDHSTMGWKDVHGQSLVGGAGSNTDFGTDPAAKGMVVVSDGTWDGNFLVNFDFNHFTDEDATYTDFSIFGAGSYMIPTNTKSPLIRYRTSTTNTQPATAESTAWFYAILSGDLATDPWIDAYCTPNVYETHCDVDVAIWAPGVTNTEPSGTGVTLYDTLASLYQSTPGKWYIWVKDPSGNTELYHPYRVLCEAPSTANASDYGFAKIPVMMTFTGEFFNSGTYLVSIGFESNDNDTSVPEITNTPWTITAAVPQYMATPQYSNIISLDDDVKIKLSFSSD